MVEIKKKPTKTISGVAPVSVMLPPRKCDHGACLYCPTLKAPQSYTPESPAVLRARANDYEADRQVRSRIKTLEDMGHSTDKVELIIMGGTFLSYPRDFQFEFVKKCYDALNEVVSENLDEAKKLNESSKHRCIALCIETRPDVCNEGHIRDMLFWGATRVEIGVQAIDDYIYKKINRCHDVATVKDATGRLKMAGFKLGYHLMPGLPGSSPKKDISMFKEIFSDDPFKPDQIKIYPCQVLKGAGLEHLYYGGEYVPYTKEQTRDIIIKMLSLTPRYCRIMRIMREIPPAYLVAGIVNLDMRKDVEEIIRAKKLKVKEIRFREIGFELRDKRTVSGGLRIKSTKYRASGGTEYFIEYINEDEILFGLVRLRLEKDKNIPAMVRELHVYGPTLNIGQKAEEEIQHKGIGKELMKKAEDMAIKQGYGAIRVISGVGVREYYRKLGYELDKEGIYMQKRL